jgi:hypothetical protein
METNFVRVEAEFASNSTLLMASMPIALVGYLPHDPAITMLGITRSTNLLTIESESEVPATVVPAKLADKADVNPEIVDSKTDFINKESSEKSRKASTSKTNNKVVRNMAWNIRQKPSSCHEQYGCMYILEFFVLSGMSHEHWDIGSSPTL